MIMEHLVTRARISHSRLHWFLPTLLSDERLTDFFGLVDTFLFVLGLTFSLRNFSTFLFVTRRDAFGIHVVQYITLLHGFMRNYFFRRFFMALLTNMYTITSRDRFGDRLANLSDFL